jgi:hypothetical protein
VKEDAGEKISMEMQGGGGGVSFKVMSQGWETGGSNLRECGDRRTLF